MAKLVALEWDSAEARVAIGRLRGKELLLEHAFGIDLLAGEAAGATVDDATIGPKLAAALAPYRIGRQEALVAVGRTSIELKRMQLPPAPDEELPDMVRLQAMRQFTTIGEQWPIDFVPLGRTEANVDVLAAAISPTIVENIRQACGAAELSPRNLVLRPFAAASLLRHHGGEDSRCRLLVDVLATEADLSVIVDGQVAFVRTVRLPPSEGPTPALVQAMVGEIRRTIPAAQSQLGGTRIEQITFWGDGVARRELLEQLTSMLPLPIDWVDPFSVVQLTTEAERGLPEYKGRYAPLLGMMLDAATGLPHSVDFLHPRRRPQPKSTRERRLMWATAVVAAGCLLAGGVKWHFNQREAEIAELEQQVAAAKDTVAESQKQISHLEQTEKFLAQDINWLEELSHLSREMPGPREAIVTELVATLQRTGEGRINVKGYVHDSEQVAELENALRSPRHRVEGSGTTRDPGRTDYAWRFDETVLVDPQTPLPADEATPARQSNRGEGEPPANDDQPQAQSPAASATEQS